MTFILPCCPFAETQPSILVPPNSIATATLKDLKAGQRKRQETELAKKRRKTLDNFQNYISKYCGGVDMTIGQGNWNGHRLSAISVLQRCSACIAGMLW
jgi:hypothetical protein